MDQETEAVARRRETARWLRAEKGRLATTITDEFLRRHPDWVERYGELARVRGEEDAAFHVEFLAGAVLAGEPSAFQDYARWTAGVLAARGIAPDFLVENLEQLRHAVGEELEGAEEVLVHRFVAAGTDAIRGADAGPGPAAGTGAGDRFQVDRSLYVQAIRSGQRRAALSVALEPLDRGATVPDVYLEILQPAQYEIGRLWERNEITVANEHMATAITQYVMAGLYTHLAVPERDRGAAIVTGVEGELHQVGANMVADMLETDGWKVRFLGTQLPHQGVLEAIEEHEPKLIGISATVLSNLPSVAGLIEGIRKRFGQESAIVVGGGAFRSNPEAWRALGADALGTDLRDAVAVAARLAQGGS